MTAPTIEEMEDRARRHLDGMTVNRDAMARDVLILTAAIRKFQMRAPDKKEESQSAQGGYADQFLKIFDELFPWNTK